MSADHCWHVMQARRVGESHLEEGCRCCWCGVERVRLLKVKPRKRDAAHGQEYFGNYVEQVIDDGSAAPPCARSGGAP